MNEILDITVSIRELLLPMGIIIAIFLFFLLRLIIIAGKLENLMSKKDIIKQEGMGQSTVSSYKEENLVQEEELVAVITAAIASTLGTDSNGLVVKSIKRIPKKQ